MRRQPFVRCPGPTRVIRLGTRHTGRYVIGGIEGGTGQPGTERLLVVDDDARVRHALRALIVSTDGLSFAGEAACREDALRADEALAPDVVLLDLLLPSAEEGLQLLAVLVARGRVVVALTIRGALRAAALAAGAAAFVEKTAGADVLLQALRDLPRPEAPAR